MHWCNVEWQQCCGHWVCVENRSAILSGNEDKNGCGKCYNDPYDNTTVTCKCEHK